MPTHPTQEEEKMVQEKPDKITRKKHFAEHLPDDMEGHATERLTDMSSWKSKTTEPEEEKMVKKKNHKITRKNYFAEELIWPKMKDAGEEMTNMSNETDPQTDTSNETDPHQIYRGNTDHWTKPRWTYCTRIARNLARKKALRKAIMDQKIFDEASHKKEDKRAWGDSMPKEVLPRVRNESLPKISVESRHHTRRKMDYPGNDNIFHKNALDPNFVFWPKEKQPRLKANHDNRLPFTQFRLPTLT